MRTTCVIGLALLGCLGAAVMAAPPPLSEREAVVRCIEHWNAGVCEGATVPSWTMASKWYYEITDTRSAPSGHGSKAWYPDGRYVDGYIVDSDFTDRDKVSWGRDSWTDRPDDVDVCMVIGHGLRASPNNRWCARVRVDEPGSGNCNAWQGHMDFGDKDNEFMHLYTCVSMNVEQWHPKWSQSFKGVHQINGFHGVSYGNTTSYATRCRDFADDSFYMPIAIAWLDNMYNRRSGINDDQCPVSRGVGVGGNGQSNCWSRMYHEEYDDVFSDPDSPTWHGVIYYSPCAPDSGQGL